MAAGTRGETPATNRTGMTCLTSHVLPDAHLIFLCLSDAQLEVSQMKGVPDIKDRIRGRHVVARRGENGTRTWDERTGGQSRRQMSLIGNQIA